VPDLSVRQSILTELISRVSAIAVANGYQTDAGLRLFVGELPALGPDDPDAALALIVRDEQAADLSGYGEAPDGIILSVLPVEVQAVVKADLEQPWVSVEGVIADIKQAVETNDRSLGGVRALPLKSGRTRAFPREPGSTVVGAGVPYLATFAESWGGGAV